MKNSNEQESDGPTPGDASEGLDWDWWTSDKEDGDAGGREGK